MGELEVFGAGQLDVLSVGHGHLEIKFDESDKDEVEKAKKIITDMIKRGFAIFVHTDDGGTKRVKRFNAKTNCYIIDDTPPDAPAGTSKEKEVPTTSSRATAVGRTAGG
jgi:hypothetical protein